jgi:hypothetical protein
MEWILLIFVILVFVCIKGEYDFNERCKEYDRTHKGPLTQREVDNALDNWNS